MEVSNPQCDLCAYEARPLESWRNTRGLDIEEEVTCTISEPFSFFSHLNMGNLTKNCSTTCTELAVPVCIVLGGVHCTYAILKDYAPKYGRLRIRSTNQFTWTYVCILGG